MELDDRKRKILLAIIQNYQETGEPVGSRTISKSSELSLSSATIRNEMSDLEEMGYIIQPHTSAGRIPSDAGYRLYVDRMMEEKDQEVSEMTKDGIISEENFIKIMEYMSECDYRIREGANPRLQLEALISKFLILNS